MTLPCDRLCPFFGCYGCAYKDGESVAAQGDSGARTLYTEGASNEAAPAGAANTSCSGASPFNMGRTYRDGTP